MSICSSATKFYSNFCREIASRTQSAYTVATGNNLFFNGRSRGVRAEKTSFAALLEFTTKRRRGVPGGMNF